jgi:predicted alpha/beta hydrolase
VRFRASDSYELGGILHLPPDRSASICTAVLHTGCGTSAWHYRHFATYLASLGIPSLIYDYRGIGASRPERLKGFDAGFEAWGQLDARAALEFMLARYPGAQPVSIAHSIGCLIALASPVSSYYASHVMICPHTAYFPDYRPPWRLAISFLYRYVMPLLAASVGYFPASLLRIGDDLPRRIALQWASRTGPEVTDNPKYWDVDRLQQMLECIKSIEAPALILSATDDAFASEDGVRRFLFAAASLSPVRRSLDPRTLNLPAIGHWGFFRRRNSGVLWPIVSRFLPADEVVRERRTAYVA